MVEVKIVPLDVEICKQRAVEAALVKHIKDSGYVLTGTVFEDTIRDSLWEQNRLGKLNKGWIYKNIISKTEHVMYFSYNEKECKVTVVVDSNAAFERILPIARTVFDVKGVTVEIKKNYCENQK